jgi:hypothetical protein
MSYRLRYVAWVVMALLGVLRHPATAEELWFAPPDDLPRANGHVYGPDFKELFHTPSQWQDVLAKISVFELTPRYAMVGSEQDLVQIFEFLHQHHIALAIGMQMVNAQNCGTNVEGMTGPGRAAAIAARIKRLGGDLRYVGMDEPMRFGTEFAGANACRYSITETAVRVAENVRAVQAVFPDVQIVDAEPVEHLQGTDWLARLQTWFDAYAQAVGKPIAYFQADPWWDGPWRERMPQLLRALRSRHIAFGVMLTASGNEASDEKWISAAKLHVQEFEDFMHMHPDQAIVVSWTLHPSRILPETSPGALSYLARWYTLGGNWQQP